MDTVDMDLIPLGQGLHADVVLAPLGWQPASATLAASWREGISETAESESGSKPSSTESSCSSVSRSSSSSTTAVLTRATARYALKLVSAPRNGILKSRRPHDVVREACILRDAQHRNIVPLVGYAFDAARVEHALAAPLLALALGDVLQHRISADHALPLFFHIAAGIFAALSYLHSSGISHRDIKPANIMFGFDGRPVLIDFGLAWSPDDEGDIMSCAVGTGAYRAPELLFSPMRYDGAAVDLWAAGTTLAEFFRPRSERPSSNSSSDVPDSPVSASSSPRKPPSPDPQDRPRPLPSTSELGLEDCLDRLGLGVLGETLPSPMALFSSAFGELGLAASIFRLLGTPNRSTWPTFTSLPDAGKLVFDERPARRVRDVLELEVLSTSEQDLVVEVLEALVVLESSLRRSAKDTLAVVRAARPKDAGASLHPLLVATARKYA